MANKKDLIQFCRYYKGEEENPYKDGDKAYLWDYERVWVKETLASYKNEDVSFFSPMLDEYLACGLREFEQMDDTPVTLKALLFNRYCHWNGLPMVDCAKSFKRWYNEFYS